MNTPRETDPYNTLSLITVSMISSIVIFAILALFYHFTEGPLLDDKNLKRIFFTMVLFASAVLITIGNMRYKKSVDALKYSSKKNNEKLDDFRSMHIIQMALYEMPALLAIVFFFLFGDFLYLIMAGLALIEMIRKFPQRKKIEELINFNMFK